MSAGGQLAGLNFPNWTGFSGQVLNEGPDLELNEVMIKAYNDWHIDEWCAAYPERFIPCGILPLFDVEKAAREVVRLAGKGCHAVTFSENPAALRMPSIHSGHWDPLFAACSDAGDRSVPACGLFVEGGVDDPGRTAFRADEPFFDRLHLLPRRPDVGRLLVALSRTCVSPSPRETSAGSRTSCSGQSTSRTRHSGWTAHTFPDGGGPADVFRERVLCCFINDPVGVSLIDHFNIDNVCWESDYPHSDSSWPHAPEVNEAQFAALTDEQVDKITHRNAMRHFPSTRSASGPRSAAPSGPSEAKRPTLTPSPTSVGRPTRATATISRA